MFGLMHGNLTQFLYAAAILLSGGPFSILLSFGSLIVMLAEIVAALVLFLVFWKERKLLPGEWPAGVTGRPVVSALYCNPGTIAFYAFTEEILTLT